MAGDLPKTSVPASDHVDTQAIVDIMNVTPAPEPLPSRSSPDIAASERRQKYQGKRAEADPAEEIPATWNLKWCHSQHYSAICRILFT